MSKRRNASRRRRERWWILRTLVRKFGGRCNKCGDLVNLKHNDPRQASVDHIVPRSKGGADQLPNLQLLCRGCNGDKADQFWEDFLGLEEQA